MNHCLIAEPTACPHCQTLDDKVFDVSKAMPGENAPPLHPNCRCSTAAYAESDEEYDKWFYETTGKHSAQWEQEHSKSNDDFFKLVDNLKSDGNVVIRARRVRFKTGGESLEEYVDKKRKFAYRSARDVTKQWLKDHRHIHGSATKMDHIVVNGVIYYVDGNKVVMEPSEREEEIANILASEKYGLRIRHRPKVNNPQGIKSADYYIDDETFDLKSPEGNGKNTLYNIVLQHLEQSDKFILDLDSTPIRGERMLEQIEKIFWSDHTLSVKTIIIFYDNEIKRIYQRGK